MPCTVTAIAQELRLARASVEGALDLLEQGATIPFIARYRKEATGGLDEVELRAVRDRYHYLDALQKRKRQVLDAISQQGKLGPELRARIEATSNKTELEDLYLPYRPKRRTRASVARDRGLEPLADAMWQGRGAPHTEARRYVNPKQGVTDPEAALAGARDIVAERLSEDATLRKHLRGAAGRHACMETQKSKEHLKQATKYDAYASFSAPLAKIRSHQLLAIERGVKDGVLKAKLQWEFARELPRVLRSIPAGSSSAWRAELRAAAEDALKRLLLPSVHSELRSQHRERAEAEAIRVFATNLEQLLLAPPLGPLSVLAIDPGQRTGGKTVVLGPTGNLLAHDVLYLVHGPEQLTRAQKTLLALLRAHRPQAVAVGNGTHGRQTEAFVRRTLKAKLPQEQARPWVISVSEAGASVYSASELAREEFPALDVSFRGAVSIGRRLQDPLSELVKVPPGSIGVGQYQHDVNQSQLARKLDEVVESCVNRVGVELNSASRSLLAYVAGVGPKLAHNIVRHRDAHDGFGSRSELRKVQGFGPKAFQQAAGFLRIRDAHNPLDRSAVHPERYDLVRAMAKDLGVGIVELVANERLVDRIQAGKYLASDTGELTLQDILAELRKPGREVREDFAPPEFREDVNELQDLKPGMALEGVVTNVTAFGAFVDLGVHQDGLVHISKLANRFVQDPNEVVRVGERIRVRVLEVDMQRKRISLSARRDDA